MAPNVASLDNTCS